jgi:hypothetical protein
MTIIKQHISGTNISISEERLSTLCKLHRDGEDAHFAQFLLQTGEVGEAVIKGLESPMSSFTERRKIHKLIWTHLHNKMGYTQATIQRVKFSPKFRVITKKKSLGNRK